MNIKPKALVFAHPFEGRTSYFLAGLSHFYQLDIYFTTSKRFRFAWQTFYKWQYCNDIKFFRCKNLDQLHALEKKYDAAFLFLESYYQFLPWPLGQKEILESIKIIKQQAKNIFWLEIGERQFFTFGEPEFWNSITMVIKGQVFKKEYEHLLKNPAKISLFQDAKLVEYPELVRQNQILDLEKYRHKIIPFPFTPTITDLAKYNWQNHPKIYDWAANTRTVGNGQMRFQVIEYLEKSLPAKYSHSIEYHNVRHALNSEPKDFDIYLTPFLGKWLFKANYGKYFYAQPLYLHNLLRSRCYLALGFTFSSLRTADAWGAGNVLINFSFDKCDYGIPVEDGYNYISIGERDEMSLDLNTFKSEFGPYIRERFEEILGDRIKQQKIVKNQRKIFEEYFLTPTLFVKKIFIEKIGVLS
jgi:hypothetical protein